MGKAHAHAAEAQAGGGQVDNGVVVYRYKLSKRTTLYGAASYTRGTDLLADLPRLNQTFTTVGISHNF